MQDGVRTFVDGLFEEGAYDQLPREVQELIMDNACEFKIETSSPDFWTPFTREDAERAATPTLLLTGEESLEMFALTVAQLHRCLASSESVIVPASSHDLPADNAEAYNQIVLEFLAKHSA